MMKSDQINELAAALAAAQRHIEGAAKDSTNPHFRSRYADLASVWAACREPLTEHGLSVVQTTHAVDNGVLLITTLMHTSGQWIAGELPIGADWKNPQSVGSWITYARRYALAALVGVCPEDDDGEAAVPASARGGNDHQHPGPRGNGNGHSHDRPPATGKALFAWAKEAESGHGIDLVKPLQEWGKGQGWPDRMTDWTPEMVAAAHAAAVRKLNAAS